jgi:hypothetical protein
MKNLFTLTLIAIIFSSCDPVSSIEANIENLTSQTLTLEFISSDDLLDKTLLVAPNEIVLFQEGADIGASYLEPAITDYDSMVIKNEAQDIIKVVKADDPGKNIYNIDDWIASEPSKRFFKYRYEIEDEDID